MIRNIFFRPRAWMLCTFTLLISLTAAPSFAGTQIGNQRKQVCNVIIEYPSHMEFGLENATCDNNGNLSGQHSISVTVDLAIRNGVRFTFDSNFLNGRLHGLTSIQTDAGFSFDGEIFPNGRTVGRTTTFDGSVIEGEVTGSFKNITGTFTQPARRGGTVEYFVAGQSVSPSEYALATNKQASKPTEQMTDGERAKIALGYNSAKATEPQSQEVLQELAPAVPQVQLSKIQLGRTVCLADLPSALYTIKGEFDGRCTGGYYSGPAKLTLTPKPGSSAPKMTVSLRYQAGQIAGPVKAKYTSFDTTFQGTFLDWQPHDGETAQPVGNDNYSVIQFQSGQQINQFTEYRQPSQSTLMGRKLIGDILGIVENVAVSCLGGDCPFKRQKTQPTYYPEQAQPWRQEPTPETPQVDTYAQEQEAARIEREHVIEDARTKQLAGLDRDGNPLPPEAPPVQIARNDPQPVFVAYTSPPETPVVISNPPVFVADTNPQGDPPVITTRPPELPAPRPATPSIPEPVRVAELPAPFTSPPLAPATELPNPIYPPPTPPVQPAPQSDTLGSGSAPSNPAPQQPAPVIQVANNPSPLPPATPAVNQAARPSMPNDLRPSGSSSSPAIVTNPIILRWSSVSGTDYYDFGISSEATGYRLVVDQRLRGTFYSGSLSPGKYRFNLRACNSRDECSGFTNTEYFEIPGAAGAPQTITQSTLSPPTQLYPTNQGELAFPVPIEWNRVTGATSYKVAVRDVTDNILITNDEVTTANTLTPRNQKSGHIYEWDVQACNQSGCSARSRNASFRTVGAGKSDSCKIEVRFKPVLRISNHAFIITSDSNSTTYFRGGPAMREKTLSEVLTDNSGNRPFGYIVTETGSYSPGTPDWTLSPSGSQVIAMVSGNCDLIDQNFGRTLADIENSKILYDPIYKNSNSVIHEALERAGYKSISPVVGAIAWHTRLP